MDADLTIDGVVASNVKVRVVPDDFQPIHVIIGRPYTAVPHIVYYKEGDNLVVKENVCRDVPQIAEIVHAEA